MTEMTDQSSSRHIFTESIHGASVGVRVEDRKFVHVKFTNFRLPPGAKDLPTERARAVANLDVIKDVEGDVPVMVRVYLQKSEVNQDYHIYIYKDGNWEDLGGNEESLGNGGIWEGYLEVEIEAGDPPIAVG